MLQWYYGLADCHGIESFVHDISDDLADLFLNSDDRKIKTTQQFAMCLRAQANAQRHCVVYRVEIPEEVADQIRNLIQDSRYVKALELLKAEAKQVMLSTYATTKRAAEKNWKMIPDPELDPYYTKEDSEQID